MYGISQITGRDSDSSCHLKLYQGPMIDEAQWPSLRNPIKGVRPFGGFEFSTVALPPLSTPRSEPKGSAFIHFTNIRAGAAMEENKRRSVRKRNEAQPKKKTHQQLVKEDEEKTVPDMEDMFTDKETQEIRASLLDWYDHYQRDLPWRRKAKEKADPCLENDEEAKDKRAYGVWVSEVMLQQTRVQTVIDYYNRWMAKWPTLHHLAQASLEEVNEIWAGLGYYRRARFLLEGAKMIVAEGCGFPTTVSSLRMVPGIGDYTAGAIASIAFNEVLPVVDGNVIRVLARLRVISANPKDKATVKKFWKLAAQLVDPCRPGDFNQSLMELGATLCTPLNPSCSTCPISGQCHALSISKQDDSVAVTDYPSRNVKTKQRDEFSAVCVVEIIGKQGLSWGDQSSSGFLLVKRPDKGLLAGLWEFPSVMLEKKTDLTTRRKKIDGFLKKSFRLDPQQTCSVVLREAVGEFTHIFSHIRLKVYVELLTIQLKGGMDELFGEQEKETMTWKCVDENSLSSLGLTSGVRKVHTMVKVFRQNRLPIDSVPVRRRNKRQRSF